MPADRDASGADPRSPTTATEEDPLESWKATHYTVEPTVRPEPPEARGDQPVPRAERRHQPLYHRLQPQCNTPARLDPEPEHERPLQPNRHEDLPGALPRPTHQGQEVPGPEWHWHDEVTILLQPQPASPRIELEPDRDETIVEQAEVRQQQGAD